MNETERKIQKLCKKLNGEVDLEERLMNETASQVISEGGDFIIQELSWAMEEKEPFAEEKVAEKKAVLEKKSTKEFGEW